MYKERVVRLLNHITRSNKNTLLPFVNLWVWVGDFMFLIFDLLFFPELYMLLFKLSGKELLSLSNHKIEMAKIYFGDTIDYDVVHLNPSLSDRIRKKAYAFVSLNIINYKDYISDDVFIHEMVHIWQYQKFGSLYAFRALLAQMSEEGYDYGGVETLYSGMMDGKRLIDFNAEQQGDIIQHAYIKDVCNEFASPFESAVYQYYINQLKD